jgi:hypothetical protein
MVPFSLAFDNPERGQVGVVEQVEDVCAKLGAWAGGL